MIRTALYPLIMALVAGCTAAPPSSLPVTVASTDALPETWRPTDAQETLFDDTPWTAEETSQAERSALSGLDELKQYFAGLPEGNDELGGDAVECFLNATYGASNLPLLQSRAHTEATRRLTAHVARFNQRTSSNVTADDFSELVTWTNYSHLILGPQHPTTRHLVTLTNVASDACGDLGEALGIDWRAFLAQPITKETAAAKNEEAYALLLWLVTLIDARTVPGLRLPEGIDDFGPRVWAMLRDYPLTAARHYPERGNDETFYDTAYLATHIGYVPTGYGRHALRVEDSPKLYVFLRENFYAVLEMGELDLVAEFVDLLRQYGANEDNDIQIRHGTRHLLRIHERAGGRWMAYRESYETPESNPYDLIHKAWTAIAGVRRRVSRPVHEGTYGAVFRSWCWSRSEPGR